MIAKTCACAGPLPGAFNRRELLQRVGLGLGGIALGHLLDSARAFGATGSADRGVLGGPHFPPRARRVIYLFMTNSPWFMRALTSTAVAATSAAASAPARACSPTARYRSAASGCSVK